MAEGSTQLRTSDGLAQLCVVALHCFFHLYWKRCSHVLQRAKTCQCFHFLCTTSAGISSLHLSSASPRTRNRKQLRLHCCQQNPTGSHQSPLLLQAPAPAPGTEPVSCLLLQVTVSHIPGSPKARLKFLAGGLGGPRNRPSACSGSSASCCLALTSPALRPLPFPSDLQGYSCCAFSRRRPLGCCFSVEGERKEENPSPMTCFCGGQ